MEDNHRILMNVTERLQTRPDLQDCWSEHFKDRCWAYLVRCDCKSIYIRGLVRFGATEKFSRLVTTRSNRPRGKTALCEDFGTAKVAEEWMAIIVNENIRLGSSVGGRYTTVNWANDSLTGLRSPCTTFIWWRYCKPFETPLIYGKVICNLSGGGCNGHAQCIALYLCLGAL